MRWMLYNDLRSTGLSEVWYRAWFGTKRPWVRVPQPGPKIQMPLLRCLDFSFEQSGTRTVKCNAGERCRRGLDRAEPLSAPKAQMQTSPAARTKNPDAAFCGVWIFLFDKAGLEQLNATRTSVAADGLTEANNNLCLWHRCKRVPQPGPKIQMPLLRCLDFSFEQSGTRTVKSAAVLRLIPGEKKHLLSQVLFLMYNRYYAAIKPLCHTWRGGLSSAPEFRHAWIF